MDRATPRADPLRLLLLADAGSAHVERWVRALEARQHQILLYSLTSPPTGLYDRLANVRLETHGLSASFAARGEGTPGKLRYLASLAAIRRLARTFRPDLIHAHYASSYGTLATLARVRPRIVSAWGMDVYSLPARSPAHRWLMKLVLGTADAVLSTSRTMREQVLSIVERAVEVTPFGVDVDRFCPRNDGRSVAHAPTTIGTVKSLEKKYGIEYLIRAFADVFGRLGNPESLRLLIVGGGSQRDALKGLARDLGIAHRVEFAGQQPQSDIHLWHQQLDIAVYPSVEASESFGVSAVESQSCAVPVIVNDIGGLAEVMRPGVTGIAVAPGDSRALADAMERLLRDDALRRTLGTAAREHVIRNFSLEAATAIMEAVYDQTVARFLQRSGPRVDDHREHSRR